MWDLSFPTRDQASTPCAGRQSLNHRTTREVSTSASQGMLSYHVAFCLWLPECPFKWFKPVGLELYTKWRSVRLCDSLNVGQMLDLRDQPVSDHQRCTLRR